MLMYRSFIIAVCLLLGGVSTWAQDETKTLEEVVIESKAPYLKLKNGAISFSPKALLPNRPIHSAYDILRYVPGLSLEDGVPKLSGIHTATILLNGFNTNASTEQLLAYLQSLDPKSIKAIELMMEAPSSTGVKGPAVNIVIDTEAQDVGWTGLAKATGALGYDLSGDLLVGLNHTAPKWNNHLSLTLGDNNTRSQVLTENRHTLQGRGVVPVFQETLTKVGNKAGSVQLNSSYKIDDNNSLSFSGYAMLSRRNSLNDALVTVPTAGESYATDIATKSKEHFYHLNARYQNPAISNISLSYAHYNGKRDAITEALSDNVASNQLSIYNSSSEQEYRSLSYNINRDSRLGGRLTATYGVYGNYNHVKNNSIVHSSIASTPESYALTGKEYEHNVHTLLSYDVSDRLGVKLGATLSHFHRDPNRFSAGIADTRLYPQLQLSYTHNKNNIFVVSMSSQRAYPSYDELSNITLSRNAYSIYRGNPHLSPSSIYSIAGQYILNQRHSISLWGSRTQGLKLVMPYQYPDRLNSIIQPVNMDWQNQIGLTISTNSAIKGIHGLNVSGSLSAVYLEQRLAKFHDLSIDKSNLFFVANMRVEYKVPGVKDLYIGTDIQANTNTIQGIYKIHSMWRVDPWISYTFWGGRATLRISCADLFNTYRPHTLIDEIGQYEEMKQWNFLRHLKVELTFRLGRKKRYENNYTAPNTDRYMQVRSDK